LTKSLCSSINHVSCRHRNRSSSSLMSLSIWHSTSWWTAPASRFWGSTMIVFSSSDVHASQPSVTVLFWSPVCSFGTACHSMSHLYLHSRFFELARKCTFSSAIFCLASCYRPVIWDIIILHFTYYSKTNVLCTASCGWFQYSSHPDLVHKCSP